MDSKIDVVFFSASRSELLKRTFTSFSKMVKFDGDLNLILHEDVLIKEASDENLEWAEGKFDKILISDPSVGGAVVIEKMLETAGTEIVFKMEDDWEFLREINLNRLLDVFENCPEVNQIIFGKRPTEEVKQFFLRKEVIKNGVFLVADIHWGFMPSLWRVSFIKKRWEVKGGARLSGGYLFRKIMEEVGEKREVIELDADWIMKNLGSYYLGKLGEPPYLLHIGGELKTKFIGGRV